MYQQGFRGDINKIEMKKRIKRREVCRQNLCWQTQKLSFWLRIALKFMDSG